MRTAPCVLAAIAALVILAPPADAAEAPATSFPGYVDGSVFRTLIDENGDMVEVDLDGPMLQAVAKSKRDDGETCAEDLFVSLKALHAVIGTVKGPPANAVTLLQQTDQKLVASGWRRVTRIKDETSWIAVLTHVSGDRIDGLVALIFDSEDKELVFANLAGSIDLARLGEIGDCFDVPGLEHVPGAR